MKKNVDIASGAAKVPPCPKPSEPMKTGNCATAPMSTQAADSSESNRKRLEDWSKSSTYQNISFWVPPNVLATPDECIAEVGNALVRFDKDKASGSIKPVPESKEANL
jgi:hypothetical protein